LNASFLASLLVPNGLYSLRFFSAPTPFEEDLIMKKFAMLAIVLGFGLSAIGCGSPAPPAKKDAAKETKDAKKEDIKKPEEPAKAPEEPAKKVEEIKVEEPAKEVKEEVKKEAKNDDPKPKIDAIKVDDLKLD